MRRPRQHQQGIVAVLVAIGLLALLAMAGLAIDTGHLVLNKSRLQSTVDAAALAAAKVLDQTRSESGALAAADSVFQLNADRLRNVTPASTEVQFSRTLSPFVPGSTPANYVRVRANNLSWRTGLLQVLGLDTLATGASAVAGPSAPIPAPCGLFPVAVCAAGPSAAQNPNDPHWGYVPYGRPGNTVTRLYTVDSKAEEWEIGPGLYHLLNLSSEPDGRVCVSPVLRHNFAAGAACVDLSGTVPPACGKKAGQVPAVNLRFGITDPPFKRADLQCYPADYVVTPSDPKNLAIDFNEGSNAITYLGEPITSIDDVGYSYKHYQAEYKSRGIDCSDDDKACGRRVVTVPIIDCDLNYNGCSKPLVVKGYGSFFLLQPACETGGKSGCSPGQDGNIFAQFIGEGLASGTPGPTGGYGVYKIVLHNDPDSNDS